MKKVLIIIFLLFLTLPAISADKPAMTDEELGELETRNKVDRIYQEEGGKRSKGEIRIFLILNSIVAGGNALAIEAINEGNYEKARIAIHAVLGLSQKQPEFHEIIVPEMALSYHLLGDIERVNGKIDEGIRYYKRAIDINPKYATAYYNLGILYYFKQDTKNGLSHLEKAFELDPPLMEVALKQWESSPNLTKEDKKKIAALKKQLDKLKREGYLKPQAEKTTKETGGRND